MTTTNAFSPLGQDRDIALPASPAKSPELVELARREGGIRPVPLRAMSAEDYQQLQELCCRLLRDLDEVERQPWDDDIYSNLINDEDAVALSGFLRTEFLEIL